MATKTKKRKPAKPKKYVPSAAEIANDPSLAYFDYKTGELIWSDDLNKFCRFNGYAAPGRLRLSTEFGIAPIDGDFDVLKCRRPRAGKGTGS